MALPSVKGLHDVSQNANAERPLVLICCPFRLES